MDECLITFFRSTLSLVSAIADCDSTVTGADYEFYSYVQGLARSSVTYFP